MPHEGEDEQIERTSLSGDEDQEVPEGGASVDAVADLADAARHPRPLQRQLGVETRHQHFDPQKCLSEKQQLLIIIMNIVVIIYRIDYLLN